MCQSFWTQFFKVKLLLLVRDIFKRMIHQCHKSRKFLTKKLVNAENDERRGDEGLKLVLFSDSCRYGLLAKISGS